MFTDIKTVKTK